MSAGLVDLHCHLDLYPDFEAAVQSAEGSGVYTLTVTTTPRAWPRNYEVTRRTRFVRAGLGFHPQLAAEIQGELTLWDEYLAQARYVGEVGLDAGPRYRDSLALQKQILEHILCKCAEEGGKILSVHSFRAATQVLNLVESCMPSGKGQIVLHWFTGTLAEARRAVSLGCYFSVNAEMLGNKKGRELAATIPFDRLLTETDGPFTLIEGRTACPVDVNSVVRSLANLRRSTPEVVITTVRKNLSTLLCEVHR